MKDLEMVATVYNRLLRLGRQNDEDVFLIETLCGNLTAFGWAAEVQLCNLLVDVFREGATADGLAAALKVWDVARVEPDDLADVPPSEVLLAMMREVQ